MNESFGIIAEFSIGLAGFSGIVALIGNASIKVHWFRVSNLLRTAFTPGFCALIGIFLLHMGLQVENVIRLASAILGLAALLNLIMPLHAIRRFDESTRLLLGKRLFWFQAISASLNILAQLFNSLIVTDYAAAILLGGLIQQLLSAAVTFSNIVGSLLKNREAAG